MIDIIMRLKCIFTSYFHVCACYEKNHSLKKHGIYTWVNQCNHTKKNIFAGKVVVSRDIQRVVARVLLDDF